MKPLITTIIPTYRRPHLLKKAVQSALAQTLREIKVCVYDNGSGDDLFLQELANTDPRLQIHIHPTTLSAAANFQYGLSRVDTPYFSILADDDLLLPIFYETALKTLQRFPKAEFFLGSTLDVSASGRIISAEAIHWKENHLYEPPLGLYQAIRHYFNWTGGVFRSEIALHYLIDPTVKPIDLDFILRLAAEKSFVVSKIPCAHFIHHSSSYSNHCGLKLVWPSWERILRNLNHLPAPVYEKVKQLMDERLKKTLFSLAIASYSKKKRGESKEILSFLLERFPHHRPSQILIRLHPLFFPLFQGALFFYRRVKGFFLSLSKCKAVK